MGRNWSSHGRLQNTKAVSNRAALLPAVQSRKDGNAVRPCVAFLHADDEPGKPNAVVDESMIPRLDAKEVAAVFSGPFHNFLKAKDEPG